MTEITKCLNNQQELSLTPADNLIYWRLCHQINEVRQDQATYDLFFCVLSPVYSGSAGYL